MKNHVKQHTTKQMIANLSKENQWQTQTIMQLGQEVQNIGQLAEVTLNILKQLKDYPELVEKMQAEMKKHQEKIDAERSEQAADLPVTAEQVTPETSTSTVKKESSTEDVIDFGDEKVTK